MHHWQNLRIEPPNRSVDSVPSGNTHNQILKLRTDTFQFAHQLKHRHPNIHDDNCPLCPDKPDNLIHCIFECPHLQSTRNNILLPPNNRTAVEILTAPDIHKPYPKTLNISTICCLLNARWKAISQILQTMNQPSSSSRRS